MKKMCLLSLFVILIACGSDVSMQDPAGAVTLTGGSTANVKPVPPPPMPWPPPVFRIESTWTLAPGGSYHPYTYCPPGRHLVGGGYGFHPASWTLMPDGWGWEGTDPLNFFVVSSGPDCGYYFGLNERCDDTYARDGRRQGWFVEVVNGGTTDVIGSVWAICI